MPTYEYQCPAGHTFERVQKISGRPRARCPECGRVAARRISGGAGLIFRGSGFYITDYGKDGKGPRKEAEAAAPKPETTEAARAETAASTESKPDTPARPPKAGSEPASKPPKSPRKKADP